MRVRGQNIRWRFTVRNLSRSLFVPTFILIFGVCSVAFATESAGDSPQEQAECDNPNHHHNHDDAEAPHEHIDLSNPDEPEELPRQGDYNDDYGDDYSEDDDYTDDGYDRRDERKSRRELRRERREERRKERLEKREERRERRRDRIEARREKRDMRRDERDDRLQQRRDERLDRRRHNREPAVGFQIWSSDTAPLNMTLKAGRRNAYFIFNGGYVPARGRTYFTSRTNNPERAHLGFGLGARMGIGVRGSMAFDVIVNKLLPMDEGSVRFDTDTGVLTQFRVAWGFNPSPGFGLFIGTGANIAVIPHDLGDQPRFISGLGVITDSTPTRSVQMGPSLFIGCNFN